MRTKLINATPHHLELRADGSDYLVVCTHTDRLAYRAPEAGGNRDTTLVEVTGEGLGFLYNTTAAPRIVDGKLVDDGPVIP